MACPNAYGTADEYAEQWCLTRPLTAEQEAIVTGNLQRAAGRINLARASAGACDCTLSSAASAALKELNFILAALVYKCPCGRVNLSDSERQMWLMDAQGMLTSIRNGELELCEGETGSDFPAIGWAEQSWTPWREAEIAYTEAQKDL